MRTAPSRSLGMLLAGSLGLAIGIGACDDEPPPATTCTDWLQCYSGCRDAQYARGDDQALTQDERHDLCTSACQELRSEVDSFPIDFDLVLRNPEDVGFLWESMALCLSDGA